MRRQPHWGGANPRSPPSSPELFSSELEGVGLRNDTWWRPPHSLSASKTCCRQLACAAVGSLGSPRNVRVSTRTPRPCLICVSSVSRLQAARARTRQDSPKIQNPATVPRSTGQSTRIQAPNCPPVCRPRAVPRHCSIQVLPAQYPCTALPDPAISTLKSSSLSSSAVSRLDSAFLRPPSSASQVSVGRVCCNACTAGAQGVCGRAQSRVRRPPGAAQYLGSWGSRVSNNQPNQYPQL